VRNKCDRAFSRHIPLNTKYRPNGIVSLKASGNNGIECISLSYPYGSRLDLPDHFRNSCPSYRQPVTEVAYPGNYVTRIKYWRPGRIPSYVKRDFANPDTMEVDSLIVSSYR
jgi:hypothetical protein